MATVSVRPSLLIRSCGHPINGHAIGLRSDPDEGLCVGAQAGDVALAAHVRAVALAAAELHGPPGRCLPLAVDPAVVQAMSG